MTVNPADNFYVVTQNDIEVAVVGPFDTGIAATSYGERWQEANGDDPRWNMIVTSQLKVSIMGAVEAQMRIA